MLTIRRNEILNSSNSKLKITLMGGASPIIPSELHFAIFELNSPEKVSSPIKMFPTTMDKWPVDIFNPVGTGDGAKFSDGIYGAFFQVPHDASLGRAKIVWYFKTSPSEATFTTFEEEFETVDYIEAYGSAGRPIISTNEIRTFLRDFPEHHVLIDNYLFKDSEIAMAIDHTVNRFNRMNPPIGTYQAENFPDKYLLMIGACGWLFDSEANRQLTEQLTYQDGNIHHGITDKTQLYRQAAAQFKEEFNASARELKLQININGIMTGDGMGVRFRYNRYVGGNLVK